MNELLEKSKELVLNNIKEELSSEVIEVLSIATLALILTKPKIALEKLPIIFQNIDIIADSKSIIEISHEKLSNYREDHILDEADAAVTRTLHIDDENTEITEKRTLLLSLCNKEEAPVDLIESTIHELTHLLRFGSIEQLENKIKILDGISINYVTAITETAITETVKRKHYNMEEGIVQKYTNDAIQELKIFLEQYEPTKNSFLDKVKQNLETYKAVSYLIQTSVINLLCQDNEFKRLLDNTFEETKSPSDAILYFNSVMNSTTAFTTLSKNLDECTKDIFSKDKATIEQEIMIVYNTINKFIYKPRKK